jgi:hypothetical protein
MIDAIDSQATLYQVSRLHQVRMNQVCGMEWGGVGLLQVFGC